MPYDQDMAQQFPALLSAGAETSNQRRPFQVARRLQDASECHCAVDTAVLLGSQDAAFIDADRRVRDESGPAYISMAGKAEIRVLEVLPANFEQPILGSIHRVTLNDRDCPLENGKCQRNFAVSASEASIVFYTALSYVVSLP